MKKKTSSGDLVRTQRAALFVSGTLNALFLAYFVYGWMTPVSIHLPSYRPQFQQTDLLGPTAQATIGRLKNQPFETLVQKLSTEERDFALACLTTDHFFDVKKVVHELPESKTLVCEGKTYSLYPELNERDFAAIVQFATTEKYPFTPEGLAKKYASAPDDSDLRQLIATTPEYKALAKLAELPESETVRLLSELPPSHLRRIGQFTSKRHILLAALLEKSKTAAEILLRDDFDFAVNHLDDAAVEIVLSLVGENKRYADAIQKTRKGEKVETVAKPEPVKATKPKPAQEETVYVVQQGDSLWKIAKKHNITIDALRKSNGLDKDQIKPGKVLKICHSTGS